MFKTIHPDIRYTFESRLTDVADKQKGVLLTKETKCTDDKGELVALGTLTTFIRGLGGFGDKGAIRIAFPR